MVLEGTSKYPLYGADGGINVERNSFLISVLEIRNDAQS